MRGVTDLDSGDVILVVDSADLRTLVQSLRDSQPTIEALEVGPASPGERDLPIQGERSLRSLEVVAADGKPTVRVDGDCVRISGSQSGLEQLAKALVLFEEHNDLQEPGMHTHFEPGATGFPNGVLALRSCALAVAGPVPDRQPARPD